MLGASGGGVGGPPHAERHLGSSCGAESLAVAWSSGFVFRLRLILSLIQLVCLLQCLGLIRPVCLVSDARSVVFTTALPAGPREGSIGAAQRASSRFSWSPCPAAPVPQLLVPAAPLPESRRVPAPASSRTPRAPALSWRPS